MGLPPRGHRRPRRRRRLDAGFARGATDGRGPDNFDVFNGLTVKITDDVQGWLDSIRPYRGHLRRRDGQRVAQLPRASRWPSAASPTDAARIQELFLAGRREEAIAAMPDESLLEGTLVGSPARIRQQWEAGGMVPPGVTGVIVGASGRDELELIAELAGTRDA